MPETPDRFSGIVCGILWSAVGLTVIIPENPFLGRYGIAFPTFRWVGWVLLAWGVMWLIGDVYGLYIDRKKEREHRERLHREKASQPSQEPPQV